MKNDTLTRVDAGVRTVKNKKSHPSAYMAGEMGSRFECKKFLRFYNTGIRLNLLPGFQSIIQGKMIYITQLIYLKKNEESVFRQFEEIAIPIISKYNGRLLLRIRPGEEQVIEKNIPVPYEIHLVEFDSESDFVNFTKDEERKKFLHLKERSIESAILIKGIRL